MNALRPSHLQPILPPLSSTGGARPCTAIVARQQMKSKITLSGPASVEFVSLGSSCGRALPCKFLFSEVDSGFLHISLEEVLASEEKWIAL